MHKHKHKDQNFSFSCAYAYACVASENEASHKPQLFTSGLVHLNKVAEASVDIDKRFPRFLRRSVDKKNKTQAWARVAKQIEIILF